MLQIDIFRITSITVDEPERQSTDFSSYTRHLTINWTDYFDNPITTVITLFSDDSECLKIDSDNIKELENIKEMEKQKQEWWEQQNDDEQFQADHDPLNDAQPPI